MEGMLLGVGAAVAAMFILRALKTAKPKAASPPALTETQAAGMRHVIEMVEVAAVLFTSNIGDNFSTAIAQCQASSR